MTYSNHHARHRQSCKGPVQLWIVATATDPAGDAPAALSPHLAPVMDLNCVTRSFCCLLRRFCGEDVWNELLSARNLKRTALQALVIRTMALITKELT